MKTIVIALAILAACVVLASLLWLLLRESVCRATHRVR
jgi:hypothetical protein